MEPERAIKENRAFCVLNVMPAIKLIDSSYELRCFAQNPITNTGYLKICELISKTPGRPMFTGRWDEKAETLDIDVDGATGAATRKFKKEIRGYMGHHPVGLSGEIRSFAVYLEFEHTTIFDGLVSFGLLWETRITERTMAVEYTDAEVVKTSGI